jgi:hypothetical protein
MSILGSVNFSVRVISTYVSVCIHSMPVAENSALEFEEEFLLFVMVTCV